VRAEGCATEREGEPVDMNEGEEFFVKAMAHAADIRTEDGYPRFHRLGRRPSHELVLQAGYVWRSTNGTGGITWRDVETVDLPG
jgi:hypothetical protein